MEIELIPPNTFTSQLQQRLFQLRETLSELTRSKKKQTEGHLRVAQKGSARPQYYQYTSPDDLTGKYIRKKNLDFAKSLAQKDYDENIIPLIQKEIKALEDFLIQTKNGNLLTDFYTSLCPARRALITPVTLTDEDYAARWQEVSWTGRSFTPDYPPLFTAHEERVRSKSEVLIADTLYRHGIPYRYEFPVTLRRHFTTNGTGLGRIDSDSNHKAYSSTTNSTSENTITLYPDFLCLNKRTRTEFIWEHFGLMDEPAYSNNAAGKLRLYTENGILPGHHLIITMETKSEPISTHTIEQMIKVYLN